MSKQEENDQSEADTSDVNDLPTALAGVNISADHGEEKLFDPPLYKQRYMAVADLINKCQSKSVVDMGCSEGQFLQHVKWFCPKVEKLTGVDIDLKVLERNKNNIRPLVSEYLFKRKVPLKIELYQGSIIEPDHRYLETDFVACIEVIEHLYPDILEGVPNSIFGIMAPKVVVVTTPNCEYNVLFDNFSGMRHWDHKFEWNRDQFEDWCSSISQTYGYSVEISGIGDPPKHKADVGFCSQMAIFTKKTETSIVLFEESNKQSQTYQLICESVYPYDNSDKHPQKKLLNEVQYLINYHYLNPCDENDDVSHIEISVDELMQFSAVKLLNMDRHAIFETLEQRYSLSDDRTAIKIKIERCSRYSSDDERSLDYEYEDHHIETDLCSVEASPEPEWWD